MGSPLAPVLANLFMGHREKLWLETFQESKILFYRRYVDDFFRSFHSENQALLFFDYINSRYPYIRFTMEKEIDHKIPFISHLFIHFILSHKDTWQLPLLAYSLASRGGHRKLEHKVIQ